MCRRTDNLALCSLPIFLTVTRERIVDHANSGPPYAPHCEAIDKPDNASKKRHAIAKENLPEEIQIGTNSCLTVRNNIFAHEDEPVRDDENNGAENDA